MTKNILACIFVFVLVSSISFATPVNSVTAEYIGMGANGSLKIWGGGHKNLRTNAGAFLFEKLSDTGEGSYLENGIISGFCVDLEQGLARGEETYEVIMPEAGPVGGAMGSVKAGYLAELWGRYYDSSWSAGGSYSGRQNSDAEAFAAAVWEIIYEDVPGSSSGWDVSRDGTRGRGGFRASELDFAKANSWLGSLDGTGPLADLRVLSHSSGQDFLVEVPEPATVVLLCMGFLMLISKKYSFAV